MGELIVREATTVPGIVNLIGAVVMLYVKPAAGLLDKLIIFLLMVLSAFREENLEYQRNLRQVIERMLPEERRAGDTLLTAGLLFVVYNIVCALVVGSA